MTNRTRSPRLVGVSPVLLACVAALVGACSSDNSASKPGSQDASGSGGGDGSSSGSSSGMSSGSSSGSSSSSSSGGATSGQDGASSVQDATTGDGGGMASGDGATAGQDASSPGDGAPSGGDGGSTGVPQFDHVFIIMMENESQSDIRGSSAAPYINSTLLAGYAYTTNYSTTYHPSLPNYLDLTSGSAQGVTCDCQPTGTACDATCAFLTGACGCNKAVANLGDQLDGANVQWREYAESMLSPCNSGAAAPFAAKHVPFLYYDDVYTKMARCQQRVRDYAMDFATDLAAGTYRYSLISPNLCSDMHGDPSCPSTNNITQGDTWLSQEVPKVISTPGFGATGRDVLFIVWDEQTNSTGGSAVPMLCIIVSPLAKPGPTAKAYTHESLLATIEDSFGVARLGNAVQASPINDVWR